jgi:hypothetical protein
LRDWYSSRQKTINWDEAHAGSERIMRWSSDRKGLGYR